MVLRGFLKLLFGAVIVLAVILVVLVAGGYFAAKSFDPNFFRSELEKQLSRQTGMRVELGNIKLFWNAGPSIQLDGLKFYNPANLEKLLQGDSVVISADLTSLLRKKVWIPRILIQNPEAFIKRRSNGFWNWQATEGASSVQTVASGLQGSSPLVSAAETGRSVLPAIAAKAPAGKVAARADWAFGLGKIEIRDGTVQYIDETVQPAYTLQVVNCEAEVLPKESLSMLHGVLRGTVWQSTEKKIELTGDLDLDSRVLDFRFRYDGDRAGLSGRLTLINNIPHFEGTLKLMSMDLESLVPPAYRNGECLVGALSANLRMAFEGGNPEMFRRTLNAVGKIEIADGAIRNRNIIREILKKISVVIATAGFFGGEIPPRIAELAKSADTEFQRASIEFTASQGVMNIQNFYFEHLDYLLSGRGIYGLLNGQIDLSASIRFSRSISEYFIQKNHELKVLNDREGLVTVPFSYAGTVPNAAVTPDLQYIGNRALRAGAEQMDEKRLQEIPKILEPKTKVN